MERDLKLNNRKFEQIYDIRVNTMSVSKWENDGNSIPLGFRIPFIPWSWYIKRVCRRRKWSNIQLYQWYVAGNILCQTSSYMYSTKLLYIMCKHLQNKNYIYVQYKIFCPFTEKYVQIWRIGVHLYSIEILLNNF